MALADPPASIEQAERLFALAPSLKGITVPLFRFPAGQRRTRLAALAASKGARIIHEMPEDRQ